jgi:hypothetical protein
VAARGNAGSAVHTWVLWTSILAFLGICVISFLLGVAAFSTAEGWRSSLGIGVTALLLAAAAWLVGSILGFLFGLPRARLTDQVTVPGGPNPQGAAQPSLSAARYLANANLIKVSDWLTTIVIGLGLVNLGKAVPALKNLAEALNEPLGASPYAGVVGLSLVVAGVIAGFMLAYLWTSMSVRQLLEEIEMEEAGGVVTETVTAAPTTTGQLATTG